MRNDEALIAVFKLGCRAHMEQLVREGHVYMNTASYFATLEEGSPRTDPDEGTGYCQNAEGASLQVQQGNDWRTLATLSGPIRFRDEALARANVYCLHGRTQRDYGSVPRDWGRSRSPRS